MEYMFVINVDETDQPNEPGSPEAEESMGAWADYTQMLMDGGHWIAGASLQPRPTGPSPRPRSRSAGST